MIEDVALEGDVPSEEFAANTSTYANTNEDPWEGRPTMQEALHHHTESIITLIDTNPGLIPPLMAEVIDAILSHDPDNTAIGLVDLIIRELDPAQRDVVRLIAAIADAQEAAANTSTFCEWLGQQAFPVHLNRTKFGALYEDINSDPSWPRHARTYAEIRDYLTTDDAPPVPVMLLDEAWDAYDRAVLAPAMTAGTVGTDIQYAVRIMFPGGHDEIHPQTVEGTSWYLAEQIARHHNSGNTSGADDSRSFASVVRRTAVRGPWYAT